MKILTVNINKGGTGKTTFTHNFAAYLAKSGSKVLLLDFDDSTNLTRRFGQYEIENTVLAIFEGLDVKPVAVTPNIDLLAGSAAIGELKERLQTKRKREEIFGRWLADHYDELAMKYDYILIDTENDEDILTINALVVSDVVIGIALPGKDSVEALGALKNLISGLNKDFDNQTRLYFLANWINLTENPSRDLLEMMVDFPEYLGYLPRRTALASEQTIFEQKGIESDLISNIENLFLTIQGKLDEGGSQNE